MVGQRCGDLEMLRKGKWQEEPQPMMGEGWKALVFKSERRGGYLRKM